MSGPILSTVALLSMMLHSIAGCCWHHAHLSDQHRKAESVHASTHALPTAHSGCCSHRHPSRDASRPFSDSTHKNSDGTVPWPDSRCVESGNSLTLGPQVVQLVNGVTLGSEMFDGAEPLYSAPIAWDLLRIPLVLKVGVERRATTQVWLI